MSFGTFYLTLALYGQVFALQAHAHVSLNDPEVRKIVDAEVEMVGKLNPISYSKSVALKLAMKAYGAFSGPRDRDEAARKVSEMGPYEKNVLVNYLFAAKTMREMLETAESTSKAHCSTQQSGCPGDAFRHALWSALLTYHLGETAAMEVTWAHERKSEKVTKKRWEGLGFNDTYTTDGVVQMVNGEPYMLNWTTSESRMDLYNNYVGRKLAKELQESGVQPADVTQYFEKRVWDLMSTGQLAVLRRSPLKCHEERYYTSEYQSSIPSRDIVFSLGLTPTIAGMCDSHNFYVVGENFALGSWDPTRGVGPMSAGDDERFIITRTAIPTSEAGIKFKVIAVDKQTGEVVWQEGRNREVRLTEGRREITINWDR